MIRSKPVIFHICFEYRRFAGFTLHGHTWVCVRIPPRLGHHGIMQTPDEFIGNSQPCLLVSGRTQPLTRSPAHPLTRLPRRRGRPHGERRPSSASRCTRTPLTLSRGIGSSLSAYCQCTTECLNPEIYINLIYFETADYGGVRPKETSRPLRDALKPELHYVCYGCMGAYLRCVQSESPDSDSPSRQHTNASLVRTSCATTTR